MSYQNIKVFEDTLLFIRENRTLSASINESMKHIGFHDSLPSNVEKKELEGIISITKHRSFEAAVKLRSKYPNTRIGVLNFASATTPGGGVEQGSSAQEESLCRCSTLYPVLNHEVFLNAYYFRNRMIKNSLHNDTVLYTPDIIICKSDTDKPKRLEEKDFVKVDVLSCAAPNLRETKINDEELYKIHLSRGKAILEVALSHHINVLVLGAFGCGVFRNDPKIVAKAYKELLKEYSKYFTEIEFAIYCSKYDESNFIAFKNEFSL